LGGFAAAGETELKLMTYTLDGIIVDTRDAFARGLRGYVGKVAAELGVGLESCAIDGNAPAWAYVALDVRVARFPDRELALLWDERQGWSAAVETHSGEDLVVLTYRGGDVVPGPSEVASFVAAVLADDQSVGQPDPPVHVTEADQDIVAARLQEYEIIG
jgi:hypothetical protein